MDGQLHLKIPKPLLQSLKTKSDLLGRNHANVVREFIEAFVEDRLTITPTQQQKELYDDDRK